MLALMHDVLAVSIILYTLSLAGWALINFVRGTGLTSGYLGAVHIYTGLLIGEVLIGVVLLLFGHRPGQPWHYMYGLLIIFIMPLAIAYARPRPKRYAAAVLMLTALFLMGMVVRAVVTGG